MTNINIFQAKKEDENQIIDFLINNHEWKASKLIWKNIFNNNWCDLDNFGYILKDKNKIVGYFGLIFSKNKNHNFRYTANIHSWIVKPEYRGYSLLLLKKVMALEDTLFISHSTISRILKIYYRYDWKILDDEQYYLLGYYYSNSNFKTKLINNENYTDLSENNKKIYLDHKDYYSIFFKILIGDKELLVIGKKKKIRSFFNVFEIIFLSDLEVFNLYSYKFINALRNQTKCFFLKIDSRFISNSNKLMKIKIKNKNFKKIIFSKNNNNINLSNINNLYSEIFLLNT